MQVLIRINLWNAPFAANSSPNFSRLPTAPTGFAWTAA